MAAPDPRERLAHHLAETEAWLSGRRSNLNTVNGKTCSPDMDALTEAARCEADAAQAAAHAQAAQAWAATIALSREPIYIALLDPDERPTP